MPRGESHASQPMPDEGEIVKFRSHSEYRFVRSLGRGACGQTVLLSDDEIGEYFVCKKFSPLGGHDTADLFQRFKQEIKILHKLNHRNVVRMYNYFLYPRQQTGYLIMEFVQGTAIDEHLNEHPEKLESIFMQSVKGFRYLETQRILHRDIRPANLLVQEDSKVKIIDLGFGKVVHDHEDFDSSISLVWRYGPPNELSRDEYDFATEVYFIGKLFEEIVADIDADTFKYRHLISRMCQKDPQDRIPSFSDVLQESYKSDLIKLESRFSEDDIHTYQQFSDALVSHITRIESNAQYRTNINSIQSKLANVFEKTTLERTIAANLVASCFVNGPYYYKKNGFLASTFRDFVRLFHSCTRMRQREILNNLQTRLDSLQRYDKTVDEDDDIPF